MLKSKSFNPVFYFRQRGVTLVEYGLVGGLLVAICIAGLVVLGKNSNLALMDFEKGLHVKPALAKIASAAPPETVAAADSAVATVSGDTGSGPAAAPNTPSSTSGNGQTEKICLKNGMCVNVPVVSAQTLDDTTGSMGSQLTSLFSDTIMQVAEELKKQPNADSRLVGFITDLANAGHALGDSEAKAVKECMPGTQCTGNQTTLRNSLSLVISQDSLFSSALQRVQEYLVSNPGLLPQTMKNLINTEAAQISAIAEGYRGQPSPSVDGSSMTWSFSTDVQITHQSSNNICGVGGNSECIR